MSLKMPFVWTFSASMTEPSVKFTK